MKHNVPKKGGKVVIQSVKLYWAIMRGRWHTSPSAGHQDEFWCQCL